MRPTSLNKDGYFKTGTTISSNGIKTVGFFRPEYKRLVYVKANETRDYENSFYFKSFQSMNLFSEVKDMGGMEELVFEAELTEEVTSVSDRIGLHNLQKHIGTFLIVEPYSEQIGAYTHMARLTAIDPESGEDVLVLETKSFNMAGLDKPLYYPLFNAFLEWARGEKISTRSR